MTLTQNEILSGIDNMPLYEKDYDVINMLLNTVDEKMFSKIVEEVLEGNLYWSDFERFLDNTSYVETVESILKQQKELKDEVYNLSNFRKETLNGSDGDIINGVSLDKETAIVISETDETVNEKFFINEYNNFRDDILYDITKVEPTDTPIARAVKIRLATAIRNGRILTKKLKNGDTVEFDDKYIYDTTNATTYDYINPDDIFLHIGKYLFPLESKKQLLDEKDKVFMRENNITDEEVMKKIKSINLFFKRRSALYKKTNNTNGGE